jgi:arylsulfatase A-like enzyme
MKRREFLRWTGFGFLSSTVPLCSRRTSPISAEKPNILFIFTDQQHRYALGCMDNPVVMTPHLDRLAAEGVLFRSCYSAAPSCGPFRGTLMTGRFPSSTGLCENEDPLPTDGHNLAEVLERGGYKTSYVGKWHLGGAGNKPIPKELRGGFSEFIGYQCYNGFYRDVCFYDEESLEHRFSKHRAEVTTDLAIERLKSLARKSQPFALFVSYQAPHYPVQPAPEYEKRYNGKPMLKRPNYQDVDPYTPTVNPRSPRPPSGDPDYIRYGNNMDEYMRLYHAMCTQVDAKVGVLIARLKQLGIYENTAIFYTSDHGDLQGCHGLKNKDLPWEEAAGIPLIVRPPGKKDGRVSQASVDSTCFYPTILDLADIPYEKERLDGISLVPYLEGGHEEPLFSAFSEKKARRGDSWRLIREGNFKCVAGYGDDGHLLPESLFDLAKDPYEMHNLLTASSHKAVREKLLRKLTDWHSGHPVRTLRDL